MRELLDKRAGLLIGLALAAVLIAVLVIAGEKQAIVIGTVTGSAYGMVAMGLVLIYKSSGVFNFAQGEFGTVALCTLYLLHSNDIPYGFAVIGGLLAAMLLGFLTERVIIRPLFEAPRVTLLVATAGVALLAIAIQQWLFDNQGRPIGKAFPRNDRVSVFGVAISDQRLWLIGTLAVLAVLLGLFFTRTNLGLAIIGASQEPTATELVGISVRRLSTFTWVLAALLGGLAAVIAVPDNLSFTPGIMTSAYLIPAFTAAVLGGMTSLPGAFLGGVLVGIIQSVATSADIFQEDGALEIPGTPSTLIVFLVLLGVLVIRPQGLLGKSA
ncbi:MAG TPA: branched-chain amino acid ABC transporter permease [Ilumatobacteraceae bacterium]|nr:branched-chain amino acid ABC transporter permease [Ilumatobacteraceae bacterium]